MALRKRKAGKLTPEQVKEIRQLYYYEMWTLKQLEEKYGRTIINAIRGYKHVEDDIPLAVKKNRVMLKAIKKGE